MPETKRVRVYFEGDDDKAFLENLRKAKFLPENWEIASRSKSEHPGKDGLVRQVLPFIRPVNGAGGSAVVIVDLDELNHEQRHLWFQSQLEQELRDSNPSITVEPDSAVNQRVRLINLVAEGVRGRVALVPAGLPDDDELIKIYQLDRFAIDDWLLRLIRNQQVFEAVSDLKAVPYATAMSKLTEVADLFRKNNLEARKSKTYVQILRTLAAIAPSTATIVGRFVQKGAQVLDGEEFRRVLHPFLEDLEATSQALSAST